MTTRSQVSAFLVVLLAAASASLNARATSAHAAVARTVIVHPEQESKYPTVVADAKGGLHLAYVATEPGKDIANIFYSFSKGGAKWSAGVDVSNSPAAGMEPAIAVDGEGRIVVAWSNAQPDGPPDIYAAVSSDGGEHWSKPTNVSITPAKSGTPSVSASPDGTFHLVWFDSKTGDTESEIWHTQSTDHGSTWTPAADISNTPGISTAAEVAAGPKGEVAVTWADTTGVAGGQSDIWFAVSTDGGKSWPKATNISNTPGISANPAIAIDAKGVIYVVWDDVSVGDARPDIFLLVSRDGGQTFEKSTNISKTPGISSNAEIAAVGDGQVSIAWVDMGRDAKTPDIWLASSSDGGRKFVITKDLTNSPGLCSSPDVAITGHTAHVVWEEVEHFKSSVRTMGVVLK